MSYNNYHQQMNYQQGSNQRTPQQHNQYGQQYGQGQQQAQPQHQQNSDKGSDPFFNFGSDTFNMDIKEDFDDPFSGVGNRMGGFGFPDIASIERQMLGHFHEQMPQLEDGNQHNYNMDNNNNNQQLANRPENNQRGLFVSMQSGGMGPGTMISKTYCSKIDYSSGQPKEESYQSQAIKQFGEGGHSISERQEAYKNSMTGVQKAAHQRLLDDRGTKLIKQRNINTGEQSEHNIYKGIQESELSGFNKEYNDYREQVHFQDNYKYLNSLNPGKMMKQLGMGKGKGDANNFLLGDGTTGQNYNNFGNNNNNNYQNNQLPGNQFNNNYNNYGTPNQQNNSYQNYHNNQYAGQNQGFNNSYQPYQGSNNNYHKGY